jgi:hypothetical protein
MQLARRPRETGRDLPGCGSALRVETSSMLDDGRGSVHHTKCLGQLNKRAAPLYNLAAPGRPWLAGKRGDDFKQSNGWSGETAVIDHEIFPQELFPKASRVSYTNL